MIRFVAGAKRQDATWNGTPLYRQDPYVWSVSGVGMRGLTEERQRVRSQPLDAFVQPLQEVEHQCNVDLSLC